jgi:hypothetical protein
MKVLLLSICGKTNEPEDLRYLNLYLASLKKHVVPYCEAKVILFNNANPEKSEDSLTWQRVKEFGLAEVVEVRNVNEMNLPEKSVEFMKQQHWFSKIGLTMNMMFDYSKTHNFFNADWIFHTDTDIEFLPNFKDHLAAITGLTTVNPAVFISLAGDAYPYNIRYKEKEYIFDVPQRIAIYNDTTLSYDYMIRELIVKERHDTHYLHNPRLVFNIEQQKVRNDFVGLSRACATAYSFNWVACHYPQDFKAYKGQHIDLEQLWKDLGSANLQLTVSHDKGGIVQYFLQEGHHDITKIQLRGYVDMVKHTGSGWFNGTNYVDYSLQELTKSYTDSKDIWETDYQ